MHIRVLLVEHQKLFRQGLRNLIENQADMEVVGEATSGSEALRLARDTQPHIFLMDIFLKGSDGISTTRQILSEFPRSAVIILTQLQRADIVLAAIGAGARGYVLKSTPAETVVHAIREVVSGGTWLDPQIAGIVAETATMARQLIHRERFLTDREREVMALICRGASNREISCALHLSEKTVKRHASSLFRKLGVRSRSQVVLYAYEHGLMPTFVGDRPPIWLLRDQPKAEKPGAELVSPAASGDGLGPEPRPPDAPEPPEEGGRGGAV